VDNSLIKEFTEKIQPIVPGYKVVRKKDSLLMRFLGVILFFVPNFMENYGTTVGNKVYLTDNSLKNQHIGLAVHLGHEAQHVYDKQHFFLRAFGYGIFYLLPQVLALVALGSLLAIWFDIRWLWCLTALALAAPIPSYGRMWVERRGYLLSFMGYSWVYGDEQSAKIMGRQIKQFTGPAYYFMWPFKKSLLKWFTKNITKYQNNPELAGPVHKFVFDFIRERNGGKP